MKTRLVSISKTILLIFVNLICLELLKASSIGFTTKINQEKVTGSAEKNDFNLLYYPSNELNITLQLDTINYDLFILKYLSYSTALDDMYDIIKMANPTVNISSYGSDSIHHALDARPSIAANDTVLMNVSGNSGNYQLIINHLPTSASGKYYLLKDELLNTYTLLSNSSVYSFSISSSVTGTFGNSRFKIIISSSSALPVPFISFEAKTNEKKQTELFWRTSSIQQTSVFKIERSCDKLQFTEIGEIKTDMMLNKINDFYFLDEETLSGKAIYYRIKEVDEDGNCIYSNVVTVKTQKNTFKLFPNPVTTTINLNSDAFNNSNKEIKIYSNSGLLLQTITDTDLHDKIDVSGFHHGEYFLEIHGTNSAPEQIKFIKY